MRVIFILTIFVFNCDPKKEIKYPFDFIDSKIQKAGNNLNRMDLYFVKGNIKIDSLKMLCQKEKADFEGSFYFLVVFDDRQYATFPNHPFPALFNDDPRLKHIRAIYQYNKFNGYSKLLIYPINALESPPTSIQIN